MQIKTIFNFWKSAIATGIILFLCFANPSTFDEAPKFHFEDKVVHTFLYIILGIILNIDLHRLKKHTRKSFIYVTILYPIILGGLIEILQGTYFTLRSAEWTDWFCDIAGTLIAYFTMQYIRKLKKT